MNLKIIFHTVIPVKGFVNSLYHIVRRHTLSTKYHLIGKEPRIENRDYHLDIGAGTGAFVQFMNGKGWKSVGIEPDEKRKGNCPDCIMERNFYPRIAFESFLPESFDAISMWHVLEHVHDLYPYLQQIKKILKPRGYSYLLQFRIIPVMTEEIRSQTGPPMMCPDICIIFLPRPCNGF